MGLKYSVDEKFFEQWTPLMAYILGYLYADGSLENAPYLRGRYLRVTSTDRELIECTKSALSSKHTIVVLPPSSPTIKARYFLRIGDHKIYNDLTNLGLFPNKSLTMKFPVVPPAFLPHFVRGYFDGDGHVGMAKKDGVSNRLITVFVSGSSEFLIELARVIGDILDLKIRKVYKGPNAYRLAYSTRDSVKVFKYLYTNTDGQFLHRKFGVFKKFFTHYNKWADSGVVQILAENGALVK